MQMPCGNVQVLCELNNNAILKVSFTPYHELLALNYRSRANHAYYDAFTRSCRSFSSDVVLSINIEKSGKSELWRQKRKHDARRQVGLGEAQLPTFFCIKIKAILYRPLYL